MAKITVLGLGGQSIFMAVERFHASGETLQAKSLYTEPGGKGYNQAVAAARLGAQTAFIGAMGADDMRRQCEAFLQSEGVEALIETIPDHPTACACILTDALGDNRVTVYAGAANRLGGSFVRRQEQRIAQSDALLLNSECPPEANAAALEIARSHGVRVIFNPAPARREDIPLLRQADLITPNRREAAMLFDVAYDAPPSALAAAIEAAGIPRAVVTLGGDGAWVMDSGRVAHVPAQPRRAVDTTGAGDCFTAALSVALCEGKPLDQAAAFAAYAAGLSVEQMHVMAGLPRRSQLQTIKGGAL